jgi:hypothetical protein
MHSLFLVCVTIVFDVPTIAMTNRLNLYLFYSHTIDVKLNNKTYQNIANCKDGNKSMES